ncbi:MAG: hypothetical protein ABIV21_02130 [Pyrinomonadaceae bacterium]
MPTFDPSIQTEKLGFDPNELIVCDCGRKNPPNRHKCMYCGAGLDVEMDDSALIKSNLRKLEDWERGLNVVVLNSSETADRSIALVAGLASMEPEIALSILKAGVPLPIARVESESEASIVRNGLIKLGLETIVVGDAELAADKPPIRLSGIELTDAGMSVRSFNTGDLTDLVREDGLLLVKGVLAINSVDSLEKKKLRGGSKVLDETSLSSDEPVLDIYSPLHTTGFRILQAGFDFSCLGSEKSLLAAENLRRLISKITEHIPEASLVDNYDTIRRELGNVWDIETRKDPKGLQRAGFASFAFGSVSSTSNLHQFTKYSRLQRHLYEGKKV